MSYHEFDSWECFLSHVHSGAAVYYKAPLDSAVRRVDALLSGRNRKVQVSPFGYWPRGKRPFDSFMADAGHLNRFRYFDDHDEAARKQNAIDAMGDDT